MIYKVVLPILLTFLPWVVVRFIFKTRNSAGKPYRAHAPYLWLAAGIWLLAMFAPNLPLTAESDTTSTHILGGIAAGILWLYVIKIYNLHFKYWWQAPLSLYLLVSGLGVGNELFEIFLNSTGLLVVYNQDAQWDLLANNIGGLIVYAIYPIWLRHT